MKRLLIGVCATAVALFSLPAAPGRADDTPPPKRVLVYNFTYGTNTDLQTHGVNGYASDTRSGSQNERDYSNGVKDKGTITVDVLHEQPDRGLVVMISEQGDQTRKAPPTKCAVYGNGNIFCDANQVVNLEEMTLLRFLGSTFVNPDLIDAKNHWRYDQGNSTMSTVADYTITANNNGVMNIDETREVKLTGSVPQTTDGTAKITYDFPKLIPTKVDEYVTTRQSAGGGDTSTTTYNTVLTLASDSLAKN